MPTNALKQAQTIVVNEATITILNVDRITSYTNTREDVLCVLHLVINAHISGKFLVLLDGHATPTSELIGHTLYSQIIFSHIVRGRAQENIPQRLLGDDRCDGPLVVQVKGRISLAERAPACEGCRSCRGGCRE